MDKNLESLHKEGKSSECATLLNEIDLNELKKLIENRVLKSRGNPGDFIRSIFYGSLSKCREGQERRLFVFKQCVTLLQSNELSSKLASELVGILLLETDELTASNLVELSSLYMDMIKTGTGNCGKSLELFPKILASMATRPSVSHANQEMSGESFKSHVLNNLISGRWDPGSIIHLAAMFKDVPLSSDELKFLLEKLIRSFSEMDLEELPPLAYQMLLLANKGHKRLVLDGVTSFFVKKDEAALHKSKENELEDLSETIDSGNQLPQVEGTIILHITYAIKQDPDLGRELIKYLKSQQQRSPASVLAPFNVAMALSVARIHRFEDQIMDLLKAAILQSFKDAERQKSSHWVNEMMPPSQDISDLLIKTVDNCVHGWDHVSQGLVELGFVLMDSFGPKGIFGRIQLDINPSTQLSAAQKSCRLGATILKEIFKRQELVRADILEQILNRVVTKATVPVSHYLDLLANTVTSAPQILLESLPKVREAFDYLSFLPPATAGGFMKAILPLMKISMGLKDGLMLTLRKALFSRQLDSRKIATSGFLMLLTKFKLLGGLHSSQASQPFSSGALEHFGIDVHSTFSSTMNEAVCLEILGSLRRCLSQQADVRLALYEGIYDVLCQNTSLGLPIMNLLETQFKFYFEENQDLLPPIKLEKCIVAQNEQVFLSEPLAHLLCTLIQCYIKTKSLANSENDAEETCDETVAETEELLESMSRRMIKSQVEDFELDRSADFSTTTSVGIKNNIYAIVTMGCYEGLIEYNFLTSQFEPASMQNVLQLYAMYQNVADLVKEKAGGAGGGKKGRQTSTNSSGTSNKLTAQSMLSLNVVEQLLRAIYCDDDPNHHEANDILRRKPEFGRYVLNVAIQKLNNINEKGRCEGPHGENPAKIFQHCSALASVLNKYYVQNIRREDTTKEKMKTASSCLEALAIIVHIMCDRITHRVTEFLQCLDDTIEATDEELIHEHIKRFQRLAMSILGHPDEDRSVKESIHLFNIIHSLSQFLSPGQPRLEQVHSWVHKLAAEQKIDDSVVAKAVVSLLISLSVRQMNIASLLQSMAQDLHRVLGDVDQEVVVSGEANFEIITQKTAAPTVLLATLTQIDQALDDTEWVTTRQQALINTSQHPEDLNETQREDAEKGVSKRLGHFVNIFHELVQTAMPVGPCVDNLLKNVTRIYKGLTLLCKYYLSICNKKAGNVSPRFEKLVRLSGTNLTPHVYAMITHIQANQSEHLQGAADKKKKDQKLSLLVAAASKAKVLKETRHIPNLIFAIEEYENYLIQLSKKSEVNLMEHMKLSTSRDFRINAVQVTNALEGQESSESGSDSETEIEARDDPSDQDESAERENREPPNKKARKEPAPPKKAMGLKTKGRGKGRAT